MRARFATDERGAAVVIVALVAVALFGFVALAVDVARMYAERAELQTAADSAAVSGAEAVWQGPDAEAVARAFIDGNPTPHHEGTSGADSIACSATGCSVSVAVPNFELIFGEVLGLGTTSLSASARAELAAGTPGGRELMPWGIIDCLSPSGAPAPCASLSGGQAVQLSFGTAEQPGNLVALALTREGSCPDPSGRISGTGYDEFVAGRTPSCEVGKGAVLSTLADPIDAIQRRTIRALSGRTARCGSFTSTVSIDAAGFAHVRDLDDPCLVAVPLVSNPGPVQPGVPGLVTVRRLALFYLAGASADGAVYQGTLMQGLFSARAGMDDARCAPTDGVCVVKLVE